MSADIIAGAIGSLAASSAGERVISLGPSGGGININPADAGKFAAAIEKAGGASSAANVAMPAPLGNMLNALDGIDVQARSVTDFAQSAQASGGELTPGEVVELTMKCQEFMFQCQLTSNIANRSADGVQQLFRQQG